ncbi:MAG: DUF4830 domain-containing protein [Oscillospiraceae bacterium]|jgi:hypothetical protein|nr:DUF4830 domain-containing protein [Oscillospiraceae bacterium]
MFIYTAKLNKKKAAAALICAAVIIIGAVLLIGNGETAAEPSREAQPKENASQVQQERTSVDPANLVTNDDRVAYLKYIGWEVKPEPIEVAEVVIPSEFTGAYGDYNALQTKQGFNLAAYAGQSATRYTYSVTNYPTADADIVADIIVVGTQLIAGDIQSPGLDGFMQGLT